MIYLELLWSFFQIGLFSIGGGYAAMPLIQHQVVELHPWLTLEQFSDIITISQMTPGPIAINSATFVGLQLGGLPGALVATAGCVLPSCIIVLCILPLPGPFHGAGGAGGPAPGCGGDDRLRGRDAGEPFIFRCGRAARRARGCGPHCRAAVCRRAVRAAALEEGPHPCDGGRGRGGACAVHAAVRHCARMAKTAPDGKPSGAVFALYGSGMPQERPGRASQKTCREAPAVPSVPGLRAFCNSIACSVFP